MKVKKTSTVNRLLLWGIGISVMIIAGEAAAAMNIGNVATKITSTFGSLAKLMTAGCYLAGIGFSVGAIMKFKQHKDNPTQIPLSTPMVLLFVGIALIFIPAIGYS